MKKINWDSISYIWLFIARVLMSGFFLLMGVAYSIQGNNFIYILYIILFALAIIPSGYVNFKGKKKSWRIIKIILIITLQIIAILLHGE